MDKPHRHGPQPPQGPGHYSQDGRQWYDEAGRGWLPVVEGQDTLVVELEDVGAASWVPAAIRPLLAHVRDGHSWFVGQATSTDPRWPTYRITSAVFPRVHGVFDDVLPRAAWTAGMAEALEGLRRRLEAEGWLPAGHGGRDWTYRYVRPHVAWPVSATVEAGPRRQTP